MGYFYPSGVGLSAGAFTTSPGAGATLCSVTMPANIGNVWVWQVEARAGYNGGATPGAPETANGGNIQLVVDGNAVDLCVPPVAGPSSLFPYKYTLVLGGGELIALKTKLAGTTSLVYNSHIIVMPYDAPSVVL